MFSFKLSLIALLAFQAIPLTTNAAELSTSQVCRIFMETLAKDDLFSRDKLLIRKNILNTFKKYPVLVTPHLKYNSKGELELNRVALGLRKKELNAFYNSKIEKIKNFDANALPAATEKEKELSENRSLLYKKVNDLKNEILELESKNASLITLDQMNTRIADFGSKIPLAEHAQREGKGSKSQIKTIREDLKTEEKNKAKLLAHDTSLNEVYSRYKAKKAEQLTSEQEFAAAEETYQQHLKIIPKIKDMRPAAFDEVVAKNPPGESILDYVFNLVEKQYATIPGKFFADPSDPELADMRLRFVIHRLIMFSPEMSELLMAELQIKNPKEVQQMREAFQTRLIIQRDLEIQQLQKELKLISEEKIKKDDQIKELEARLTSDEEAAEKSSKHYITRAKLLYGAGGLVAATTLVEVIAHHFHLF